MTLKRLLTIALLTVSIALHGADTIPWKLPSYTLVARDMDLRVALDTFATAEGLPTIMSESVAGTFSGDFRDVPASEFLDKIATLHESSEKVWLVTDDMDLKHTVVDTCDAYVVPEAFTNFILV